VTQERLDVEAVGDDCQLGHRALQLVHFEPAGSGEDGQAVARVPPEVGVRAERLEGREEIANVPARVLFVQRLLDATDQVLETNGILLVFGMAAMRRLV
jgi:hypothetical protein